MFTFIMRVTMLVYRDDLQVQAEKFMPVTVMLAKHRPVPLKVL
jgi:hypothetical protein